MVMTVNFFRFTGVRGQVFPCHITYSVLFGREDVAWKDLTPLCVQMSLELGLVKPKDLIKPPA